MISRRRLLTLSAAGVAATATGGLAGGAAAAAPVASAATVDPLGIPLRDVLLIGGAVGKGPDGRQVLWSAASGEPAHLVAIDPATGHAVSTQDLVGAPGSYAVAVTPDDTVYVGAYGSGQLYRRRPGPDSAVENLGRPLPTETYIWRLAVDDDGVLYAGTYPGGKVFSYDPASGAVRDYGQLLPGLQYVRSTAVWGSKIYAGTQPDAYLCEIDKSSGEQREIPLPDGIGDPHGVSVYDLNCHQGRLYARFGAAIDGRLGVYDIGTRRWTALIDNVAGLDVSAPGKNGIVYLTRGGHLVGFDPRTGELHDTGLFFPGRVVNNRGIGWVDLDDPQWPGQTLVGLLWRGEIFRYNPNTGRTDVRQTDVTGEPIPIAAIHAGASGRLYVGGYLNGGMATVDPDTGAPTFRRFAQVESIREIGDTVYLGAYPDSRLYRYDPSQAWSSPEYAPGPPGTPDNPVKLVDLKPEDQVRARAMTDAGAHLAYGTMPHATLGGVLVVLDKATDQYTTHLQVVTDQSIVSLTYAGGLIIGGTSIHGGYAVPEPTQTEARLFGWDPAGGKVFEVPAVAGAEAIPALVTDSVGTVWGLSNGQLFAFDVASRAVTARIQLTADTSSGRTVGQLSHDAPRNLLYAQVQNRFLYRVDLATRTAALVVEQPGGLLAVHPDGRVFLSNVENLYRVTP